MNLSREDIARLEARKAELKRPFQEKHPALTKAGLLLLGVCVFGVATVMLSRCAQGAGSLHPCLYALLVTDAGLSTGVHTTGFVRHDR